jgi:hypothetical protein
MNYPILLESHKTWQKQKQLIMFSRGVVQFEVALLDSAKLQNSPIRILPVPLTF